MKKKIEEALSAEYKGLGLSEKTIGRLADYLLGSIEKEEDIATAVKGDAVKLLATSIQGEIAGIKRAKETAEAALADYKAKHPEKNDPDPNPDQDPAQDADKTLIERIQAAVTAAVTPLNEKIAALENLNSTKAALTSARESFFGGDYAKKYKDEADDAWERAVEMNEATGNKMTAEELAAKATGYFNKAVSRKGVDTSKPFVADKTGDEDEGTMDWSAEKKRLQDSGRLPKEQ
jgi:hypothetical protein